MMLKISAKQFPQTFPIPQLITRFNEDFQFYLFSTPWGDPQATEMAFSEIEQYLSASLQDSEVTSPFERFEFFDKEGNELRIATLIANEKSYRTLNQDEYTSACELTTILVKNNRIYFCSIGGHEICLNRKGRVESISAQSSGSSVGFPDVMLGLYKQCLPRCGSFELQSNDLIFVQSSSGLLLHENGYVREFQNKQPRSDIKKGMWISALLPEES